MLEWVDEGVVGEFELIAGGDRRGTDKRMMQKGKETTGIRLVYLTLCI